MLVRWLFMLALLVAGLVLVLQATAPRTPYRYVRRARRALGVIARKGRTPETRKLLEEARSVAAAIERLEAGALEVRGFLQEREMDELARRRLQEHLGSLEAQMEAGTALLERLAAEQWAREPLDLHEAAARLARARRDMLTALEPPTQEEGVN